MASRSVSNAKILGIVLFVIGLGLLLWGHQLSGSFNSQLTRAFTGSDTDKVMTLYLSGAMSFVLGIYLFFRK